MDATDVMERSELPQLPKYWDTITDPQENLTNALTYSAFSYEDVVETLKITMRRCLWPESLQWFLEAKRTGRAASVDVVKKLLLFASAEIGPANPSITLMLDDFLEFDCQGEQWQEEIIGMLCTEILTKSPKSRLFSWAISCAFDNEQFGQKFEAAELVQRVEFLLLKLEDNINERDFEGATTTLAQYRALAEANPLARLDKDWFAKWKEYFKAPVIIKSNLLKIYHQIWIPILAAACRPGVAQEVCTLCCRLYHITIGRNGAWNWRGDTNADIFCLHAIWAICNQSEVLRSWYPEQLHRLLSNPEGQEYLQRAAEMHLRRSNIVGMPKNIRGDLKAFIETFSRIEYMLPDCIEDERRMLANAIRAWKRTGKLPTTFGLYDTHWLIQPKSLFNTTNT